MLGAFFKDDYSCWRNKGLVDALCVQIPEQVHKELPELLPNSAHDIAAIRQAFVESLLWRRTDAFSESTREFINRDVLPYRDTSSQFWNAIITLAPIPEHPFNANALHRNLIGRSMPDRDAWWSTFIHTQYRRQSAIDRLLDWAWSPLKPKELETDSAILYATALAWLLPSSNRFLRDHATKSLAKVIGERSEILLDLIEKFRTVNDPYIVERICAVAYGCATKSNDKEKLTALATSVYQWIFAASSPDTNVLSRDYARGVVESALRAGAQLPFDPEKARPPYKSAWPQTIPSKDELEAKYGWRKDQMPQGEWSRLAIYSSWALETSHGM